MKHCPSCYRLEADDALTFCRADGKELFDLAGDKRLMAAPVSAGADFKSGPPVPLFKVESMLDDLYDVTADGQRFLINSTAAESQTMPFTVVLNWTADLKR